MDLIDDISNEGKEVIGEYDLKQRGRSHGFYGWVLVNTKCFVGKYEGKDIAKLKA